MPTELAQRRGRKTDMAPRARVVRYVKDLVTGGDLLHGEPLPSERVLAERLEVSRDTVRSALRMLDEEGMIRSNGGRLRIVSQSEKRGGLMKEAIVLLSGDPTLPQAQAKQSGWAVQVDYGAQCAIRDAGYHAVVLHPSRLSEETAEHLAADRPLGVVIPETADAANAAEWAARLRLHNLNVVTHGDNPELAGFDHVSSDHEAGAYALTQWLISQGRRRIVQVDIPISPGNDYWVKGRRAGYEKALREAGLEVLAPVTLDDLPDVRESRECFDAAARRTAGHLAQSLTSDQPTDAFMAVSDYLTFVIAAACRLCHKVPGKDVLVAGYDNYWTDLPLQKWEASSPAATVDKRNAQLGAEMVKLLLQRSRGQLPLSPQRRFVTPELVVVQAEEIARVSAYWQNRDAVEAN